MFGEKVVLKMVDMGVENEMLRRDKKQLEHELSVLSHEKHAAEWNLREAERRHTYQLARVRIDERLDMWFENNSDEPILILPYQLAIDVASTSHSLPTAPGASVKKWITLDGRQITVEMHDHQSIKVVSKREYAGS